MGFRQRLIAKLENEYDINEDVVAEGFAQVIRGETVKEYKSKSGVTIKSEVTRKPEDVLNGIMLYDSLMAGNDRLGISSHEIGSSKKKKKRVHKKLAVDNSILANSHPTAGERVIIGDEE